MSSPSTRTPVAPLGDHGGDGAAVARSLGVEPSSLLDLSASLNPVAPDPVEVVGPHLASIRSYPDAAALAEATGALAERLGVAPERVLLTNGGAEAIALVAAELGRGWVEEPEFSLYRRHIPRLERGAPLFRSNPHNPTGRLAADGEQAGVWDEAFYPLSTGRWSRRDFDRGVVVVGSLTKLLSCPGLRVGYVVTPDARWAARLGRRQPQWSVNSLVCAALPRMLSQVDLAAWAAAVAQLRAQLISALSRHGLRARPSDAPYVLVDAPPGTRDRLARRGVLVRDCSSFGLPGAVRVAVPDASGLARLDEALGAG